VSTHPTCSSPFSSSNEGEDFDEFNVAFWLESHALFGVKDALVVDDNHIFPGCERPLGAAAAAIAAGEGRPRP
jgi:hypothetical protein